MPDAHATLAAAGHVESHLAYLLRRMHLIGAPDDVLAAVRLAAAEDRLPAGLHHLNDVLLAERIGAILAGSPLEAARADAAYVDAALADSELWIESRDVVGTSEKGNPIPGIIMWAGSDGGRAAVAHMREIERATDTGTHPRSTLLRMLRGVHGRDL